MKGQKGEEEEEEEEDGKEEGEVGLHCERLCKKGHLQEEEERSFEEVEWINHSLWDPSLRNRVQPVRFSARALALRPRRPTRSLSVQEHARNGAEQEDGKIPSFVTQPFLG